MQQYNTLILSHGTGRVFSSYSSHIGCMSSSSNEFLELEQVIFDADILHIEAAGRSQISVLYFETNFFTDWVTLIATTRI